MYKLWKASTIVFVFQFVVGASVYVETGGLAFSVFCTVFTTFLIASRYLINDDGGVEMVALPATVAMTAVFMATLGTSSSGVTSVIVALISVWLTYLVVRIGVRDKGVRDRKEPWPLLFVVALPLGIGTIAGMVISVPILLYRSYQHFHEQAGWN